MGVQGPEISKLFDVKRCMRMHPFTCLLYVCNTVLVT